MDSNTLKIIAMCVIGYLLGSIPSGVWIGKLMYGKDVRDYGSGNMGTTNTFRVLGKKAGIIVLVMDMFKGTLTALLPVYNPEFFLIAWVIFLITLYVSSMVSVASMVGFTLITVVSLFYNDPILTIVALALTIFIFIRHWGNIERIKNGTENMVHFGLLYRKKQKENK